MKKDRKRLRLKDYDYSQEGYYFVTICTKDQKELFGEIVEGEMVLNGVGEIVEQCWIDIVDYFQNIMIDEYVVMPNHFHGIVGICREKGDDKSIRGMINHARTQRENRVVRRGMIYHAQNPIHHAQNWQSMCNAKMTLGKIIRHYKAKCTRLVRKRFGSNDFQWHRVYYDHVIRNDKDLERVQQYISENPMKWDLDENNLGIFEGY